MFFKRLRIRARKRKIVMKELHVTEESVDVKKTLQATESIAEVIW